MEGDDADRDLPHALALAWGVATDPRRGPKRELTIERIVAVAVELADEGGLAAVSMSAVATRLGFSAMSLYRYVSAKDDLITLMQDHGVGPPPTAIRRASGWRDGLRTVAHEQIDVYRRHPWILDIPVLGAMATPNNTAWLDAGLEILAETPLDEHEKVAASLTLLAQTRWQALVERSYLEQATARGTSTDDVDRDTVTVMRALVTAERFPSVRTALDAGAFDPSDDDPFVFGIERILDGLELHIERRQAGHPGAGG